MTSGLSIPTEKFKPVLDLFDKLRSKLEYCDNVSLPSIVVVGSQSHGKSSLLEQISGILFPKASEMKTKLPLEMRLRNAESNDEYATIECKYVPTNSKYKTSQRISFIQIPQAIDDITDSIIGVGVQNVDDKVITLTIYKKDMVNLTFIDLPGLTVVDNNNNNLPKKINDLVFKRINNDNTIILNVLQQGSDLETYPCIQMSKKVDSNFNRTVFAFTKCDLIGDLGFKNRFDKLVNEFSVPENHIFLTRCMKAIETENVSGQSNADQIIMQMRKAEMECFKNKMEYGLDKIPMDRKGSNKLAVQLAQIQKQKIIQSLPNIFKILDEKEQLLNEQSKEFKDKLNLESNDELINQFNILITKLFDEIRNSMQGIGYYDSIDKDQKQQNEQSQKFNFFQKFRKRITIRSPIKSPKNNKKNYKKKGEQIDCELSSNDELTEENKLDGTIPEKLYYLYANFKDKIISYYPTNGFNNQQFWDKVHNKMIQTMPIKSIQGEFHTLVTPLMVQEMFQELKIIAKELINDNKQIMHQRINIVISNVFEDYSKLSNEILQIFDQIFINAHKSVNDWLERDYIIETFNGSYTLNDRFYNQQSDIDKSWILTNDTKYLSDIQLRARKEAIKIQSYWNIRLPQFIDSIIKECRYEFVINIQNKQNILREQLRNKFNNISYEKMIADLLISSPQLLDKIKQFKTKLNNIKEAKQLLKDISNKLQNLTD